MKFDTKLIGYVTTFENYTKARVKDCFFLGNELVFIVNEGNLGKAVGKSGSTVQRLSKQFRHRLRVIEFSNDPPTFIRNLLYPLKGYEVSLEGEQLIVKASDSRIKGKIYGRDRENLKWMNGLLKNYFKNLKLIIA